MLLLAGDVGGTKTDLAVFSPEAGVGAPLAQSTFPSARYDSLEALVHDFLSQAGLQVERASFGVAGPVVSGRAAVTNLPWVIDSARLQEALHLSSVCLINDLVAIASAVPVLRPADLHCINVGQPVPGGAIAVIAPGTGLGEAFLTWNGAGYRPHPSEGGHADFAPTNSRQADLLNHLRGRWDHVSYERVCSGRGLPEIYQFLRDGGHAAEPGWLATELAQAGDPTPVIVNAALDRERPCKLCVATLDIFVSILGAEAGNLALKVLATGGVYLGGGIPRHIMSTLEQGRFLESFREKGRFSDLLSRVPVQVIMMPKAALLGAAWYGLMM